MTIPGKRRAVESQLYHAKLINSRSTLAKSDSQVDIPLCYHTFRIFDLVYVQV